MKREILLLPIFMVLVSCVPTYDNYYKLDAQYLMRRQLETRRFETDDEEAMLVASAQVLQDLGFTLEESETKLGLITASKNREGSSTGEKIALTVFAALIGTTPVYDTEQKIYTTLVSTKNKESKGFNVRVEFARVIVNNHNQSRVEIIREPEIYNDFFDKLGQSLFLTANSL